MNQPIQSNVIRPGFNLRFTFRSIVTMRRRLSRGFCLVSVERKDQQLRVVTWWRWELVLKHGGIKQGSLESVPKNPMTEPENGFHGTQNTMFWGDDWTSLAHHLRIWRGWCQGSLITRKVIIRYQCTNITTTNLTNQSCSWLVNLPRKNNVPPWNLGLFFKGLGLTDGFP